MKKQRRYHLKLDTYDIRVHLISVTPAVYLYKLQLEPKQFFSLILTDKSVESIHLLVQWLQEQ
jgi:hypothetical protein